MGVWCVCVCGRVGWDGGEGEVGGREVVTKRNKHEDKSMAG